jgi:hypothetical protein
MEHTKTISDGTARIESWYENKFDQRLYTVIVENTAGSSLSIPLDVTNGTKEKVKKIMLAIKPQDTFMTILENIHEFDRL